MRKNNCGLHVLCVLFVDSLSHDNAFRRIYRPSRDDISNGWTAPKLSEEEIGAHDLVMPNDVSAISVGLIRS